MRKVLGPGRGRTLAIVVLIVALVGAFAGGVYLSSQAPKPSAPIGFWELTAWSLLTPILSGAVLILTGGTGDGHVTPLGTIVVLSCIVQLALGMRYLRRGGETTLIGVAASGMVAYLLGSFYLFDAFLGGAWF